MGCNYPVRAYRLNSGEVVWHLKNGNDHRADLMIPCGQCLGCKLERSRQWAIRVMHEASQHELNCFVTLTYDDKHLPDLNSLDYPAFQLFMKRLRKKYSGRKIKFYMCGEYGGQGTERPHYHACLFGHNFDDLVPFKITKAGSKIYTSAKLASLWPYGFSTVGEVTFESAAYTARYIMKKQQGKEGLKNYEEIDRETGEVNYREREFTRMSLKPGIGATWYDKYKSDVYPHDRCVVNGKAVKPPKYYHRRLKEQDPGLHEEINFRREERAGEHREDNTEERLEVKERVLLAKLNLLKREL